MSDIKHNRIAKGLTNLSAGYDPPAGWEDDVWTRIERSRRQREQLILDGLYVLGLLTLAFLVAALVSP